MFNIPENTPLEIFIEQEYKLYRHKIDTLKSLAGEAKAILLNKLLNEYKPFPRNYYFTLTKILRTLKYFNDQHSIEVLKSLGVQDSVFSWFTSLNDFHKELLLIEKNGIAVFWHWFFQRIDIYLD